MIKRELIGEVFHMWRTTGLYKLEAINIDELETIVDVLAQTHTHGVQYFPCPIAK